MANSLWTFLNTDIRELVSLDTVDTAIDTTDTVMGLAEALEDQELQDIALWVEQGASMLDILNAPEAELVEALLPFAKIATGLLKFYLKKSKKDLTFPDCVMLVGLKAYSESVREFVQAFQAQNPSALSKPTAEQKAVNSSKLNLELTETEANQVLLCFQQSKLAEPLQTLMAERLQSVGVPEPQAQRLTERAVWKTHRYITKAWSELPAEKQRFGSVSIGEWREEQAKYDSIDTYLTEYVSPNPTDIQRKQRWQVFNENFTLPDIYVSLKAQPLTANGDRDRNRKPIGLEDWAMSLLNDLKQQDQVLFIQAGPGRGKSVFCRIFANWVRENLYPIWIPIVIRLRDIATLQNSFEETLRSAVHADFARTDDGWLTDKNHRYLFFLDGFDELLMEGRTSGGLEQFLRQVGQFQQSCTSPEMGHRGIVTGRTLALHGVERNLPNNLSRVKILPMGEDEQQQWFQKWGKLVNADPQNLNGILNDQRLPDQMRELAREPLLLYLLAAMHRDKQLSVEMFAGAEGASAKVLIYQKTLDWVLTKQRPDWLNRDLTELETDALYRILAEAGLCVIQSGGECASLTMIEQRLKSDDEAKELLEQAQEQLNENPLRNALAAFYLQPGRNGEGSVEFVHKSFSEFLCADRIKRAIEDWIAPGRRNKFEVSDEQLIWEIYDLLGAPVFTEEIVEYLFELLQTSNNFQPVPLFQRLHDVYLRWCAGEFLDQPPTDNLPQKKMLQLQGLNIPTGLKQVDVYAGLNVLILLFKLHAAAQHPDYPNVPTAAPAAEINFHPCGGIDEEDVWKDDQLLKIIYYADSISPGTFTRVVGPHLAKANLDRATLDRAKLDSANLSRATLDSATLSSANLSRATLDSATLSSANLSRATLDSANLYSADLENISWDEGTNWTDVEGLETAENVPEELKQQLGLE